MAEQRSDTGWYDPTDGAGVGDNSQTNTFFPASTDTSGGVEYDVRINDDRGTDYLSYGSVYDQDLDHPGC